MLQQTRYFSEVYIWQLASEMLKICSTSTTADDNLTTRSVPCSWMNKRNGSRDESYDLIQSEFLKHLGPKALYSWLSDLFTTMIWVQTMSKTRRQTKIVILEKNFIRVNPHLTRYRPMSLLSVFYNVRERVILYRISTVTILCDTHIFAFENWLILNL